MNQVSSENAWWKYWLCLVCFTGGTIAVAVGLQMIIPRCRHGQEKHAWIHLTVVQLEHARWWHTSHTGCTLYTFGPSPHWHWTVSRSLSTERVVAVLHRYTGIPIGTSHMSDLGISHISHADISHIFLRLHYYMLCTSQHTGRWSVLGVTKELWGRLHNTSPSLIGYQDGEQVYRSQRSPCSCRVQYRDCIWGERVDD